MSEIRLVIYIIIYLSSWKLYLLSLPQLALDMLKGGIFVTQLLFNAMFQNLSIPKKKVLNTESHIHTQSRIRDLGWHSLVLACVLDNIYIYIYMGFFLNCSNENEKTDFVIEWSNIRIKEDEIKHEMTPLIVEHEL